MLLTSDHPCKGMTKAQIAAFERIAINDPPYASERTLEALLKRGAVERTQRQRREPHGFVLTWWEYHVPLTIHAQWCAWCSEQPEALADVKSE